MFLTTEQVQKLTGYDLAAYQSSWLKEHGIVHMLNAKNEILVTEEQIKSMFMPPNQKKSSRTKPDEEALRKELGI